MTKQFLLNVIICRSDINPVFFFWHPVITKLLFLFIFFFAKCSDPADILSTKSKSISKKSFAYEILIWILLNTKYSKGIVSFIPYFCLLVFGILVTLVAWFSFHFLAKCKQGLCNIFVAKSDQKRKKGWTKHKKEKILT